MIKKRKSAAEARMLMALPSAVEENKEDGFEFRGKLEHNRIQDSTVRCRLLSYGAQFIQVRSEIATWQNRLQLPLEWSTTHLQLLFKLPAL